MVAGTHSGVGKTTVATGLMAALRPAGVPVASAKVGPDFIDPGYHALATGRPGRNLDAWMCGADADRPARRPGRRRAPTSSWSKASWASSTAPPTTARGQHRATSPRLLDAPVVLVVDASAMSGSVAALVHGFATFDPRVRMAGVVLNRVGSDGHEAMLREALAPLGVPVLGVLRRDDALRLAGPPPRPGAGGRAAPTRCAAALDRLAAAIERGCDLDAFAARWPRAAPAHPVAAPPRRPTRSARPAIAVAGGPAFSFIYPDNLEALDQARRRARAVRPPDGRRACPEAATASSRAAGSPRCSPRRWPPTGRCSTTSRRRVRAGLVIWAECGGLLWLARIARRARARRRRPRGRPHDRPAHARLPPGRAPGADRPLGPAGTELRGHEFHYSTLDPPGDALDGDRPLRRRVRRASLTPALLASYLHLHLAAAPGWAERFVASAASVGRAAARRAVLESALPLEEGSR